MSYKECDKGLLVSFAARATGVALQICAFASGRKGFQAKRLLPTATASVAGGCFFNGLTRRSTQDCPLTAYYLPPPVHPPQAWFLAGRYRP